MSDHAALLPCLQSLHLSLKGLSLSLSQMTHHPLGWQATDEDSVAAMTARLVFILVTIWFQKAQRSYYELNVDAPISYI